ncbi:Methyltransferase domain-containing protein [Halogranum amylolyticum]|uniref:Methyltransferase domain-containing protein n=2 Tax=Halogranum amylolyticum TaxID=660520 RepID=A0A1H8U2F7_9EURY|nr:Methyltransferase domain-containing protein [Halogranum amylolyticum]
MKIRTTASTARGSFNGVGPDDRNDDWEDDRAVPVTDAFGRMCRDYARDELAAPPTYHRDDGETNEAHLGHYFDQYDEWAELDRVAVDAVEGVDAETTHSASVPRTLDLGCGVGRTMLRLQSVGHDVLGVDVSPGAVAVTRERGVERAAVMDLFSPATVGPFDAALVVGQQWCAAGTRNRFRRLLCDLAEVVRPGGTLVGDVADPTEAPPEHESYMADHRVAPGVVTRRFRLAYDGEFDPWVTLLMLSIDRFREVVADTPWTVSDVHRDGGRYVAVLRRQPE